MSEHNPWYKKLKETTATYNDMKKKITKKYGKNSSHIDRISSEYASWYSWLMQKAEEWEINGVDYSSGDENSEYSSSDSGYEINIPPEYNQ